MKRLQTLWLLLALMATFALPPHMPAADDLVISEFMALNFSTLADEDGDFPDWIEIHNRGTNTVQLLNWSLTDNAANLNKWRFPATNLQAGAFLIVFASGKDRRVPGAPLHTDFELLGSGEFLALVRPDGTVATSFSPKFPSQVPDVSFGFGLLLSSSNLLTSGSPLQVFIPSDDALGLSWTEPEFDDAAWISGTSPVGFDTGEVDPSHNSAAQAIADSVPLAYWRMSELSGTVAANAGSLGSAVNGIYLGNYQLNQAGPRPDTFAGFESNNTCVRLNGTTGRIQVPDNPSFDFGTGPFTIELWFKAPDPSVRGDLFTYKGGGEDFGIHLASQSPRTISVYHNAFIGTGGAVRTNQWHHLVVVRADTLQVTAYLDGVPIISSTDTRSMSISSDLLIGSNHSGTPSTPAIAFVGSMDEVALYARALGSNEVAGHYQAAVLPANVPFAEMIATDLRLAMHGVNSSAFVRVPFTVADPGSIAKLRLRLRYDDGFLASVNGQEVTGANAPDTPAWNAPATTSHPDTAATNFVEFDISDARSALRAGGNVLALHGLNAAPEDPDVLLDVALEAITTGQLSNEPRYFVQPSPADLNGQGTQDLGPIISHASQSPPPPNKPNDADDIIVTAQVVPAFSPLTAVTLNYHVMFGSLVSVPMSDDGLNGDSVVGDGVFGAIIPASVSGPGQMVRWFITATDFEGHTSRWPLFEDPLGSSEYFGTVVANPTVTSALPIFEWFTTDVSAAKTSRAGTRCSVFFAGQFYDNVFVRLRGGYTTGNSQKFDFNRGDHFFVNAEVGRVEEINMNGNGSDPTYIRPPLAFESYRLGGNAASHSFHMLMRVNGAADRVAVFIEQVDDEFLDRNGLDPEGALYKFVQRSNLDPIFADAFVGVQKKTRRDEDHADLQALVDGLHLPTPEQREAYLFDHLNMPQLMNFLALRSVTLDADDVRKNIYMYRDTRGNGEWSVFPWDKDWTFGVEGDGGTFLHHPFFGDYAHRKQNADQYSLLWEVLFNTPSTREMYLRRLRTIMDEQLQPPGTPAAERRCEARVDAWFATLSNALPGVASSVTALKNWFPSRRDDLYVLHSITNVSNASRAGIPNPQLSYPNINFGTIEFNPASGNQAQEFIQLVNPNNTAVDMSGWKLRGAVSHTFQPGTVIRATNALYVSPDVVAFRGRTIGPRGGQALLVQGNYERQLSARGETIQLIDARGRTVQTVDYAGAPSLAQQYLRITEIMYHPAASPGGSFTNEDYEYIELKNIGPVALDLTGVRMINGVDFDFAGSAVPNLEPGQSVLVVPNQAAFAERYGSGWLVAGQYTGRLENRGERLRLVDAAGEEILDFSYDNNWYPITDGFGFSLVIRDENAPFNRWNEKQSWRPSGQLNGSPGANDPLQPAIAPVVINELLTHTDPPVVDQVELHNPTATNVSLAGWFITDDFNSPKKFRVPDGTTLSAGGYWVFTETNFNPLPGVPPSFAFSSKGDEAYLFAADLAGNLTGYFHGYAFGGAETGVSFGRYVTSTGADHFVAQQANSLNTANAGPKVGPLVISEIMYHPPDLANGSDNQEAEFVELLNISDAPVLLADPLFATNTWCLSNAVDYRFPENTTTEAGERILVVSFDPADAARLDRFRSTFGVPVSTRVFGPYAGKLDNSAEAVELWKPDLPEGTEMPWVLVDEVAYRDESPWPAGADGTGASLNRIRPGDYGNDPINWAAGVPTAGSGYGGGTPPVILSQPASQTAIAFNEITLSVSATGDGPLHYRWRFNGTLLSNVTGPALFFPSILPEQAGTYSVVVYNTAGSALSSNATLRVNIAATITAQPHSQSVRPGTNVTFSVEATSSSVLRYQWRQNGVVITGETNTSLNLTNVQRTDDGNYDVVVTDQIGSATSAAARLTILINPTVLVPPLSQTVVQGGSVTFSVLSDGTLPMGYRWRKAFATVTNEVLNSHLSFLTLPNVQTTHAGSYTVVLTNAAYPTPGQLSPAGVLTVLPDTDGDRTPDAWETEHGLDPANPADAALDNDQDGLSNRDEYAAGTDPNDPDSYLKVDRLEVDGSARIYFGAASNHTYTVQFKNTLSTDAWSRLTDVVARPTNWVETVLDPDSLPSRYYRVVTPRSPSPFP
jgi:hypothetical protein